MRRTLSLLIALLLASMATAQPIKVVTFDETLLATLPKLANAQVAFVDLSKSRSAPQITLASMRGELLRSIPIPAGRFAADWVHWGPGISYDATRRTLWYLGPKVGLTEFDMEGAVKTEIAFPKASHQIQIRPDGTLVLPNSWDTADDAQVSVIDRSGKTVFQWYGRDYVNGNTTSSSVARAQPRSFTATTSALQTEAGNYFVALAQRNMIVKLNAAGVVTWKQDVSVRPHTLVVSGDELIGYTARGPNRLLLRNEACSCFKEVFLKEGEGGRDDGERTLSLQSLGNGLWFASGVSALHIINDEGKVFWKLEHETLRGRPIGFHSAVLILQD